MTDINLVNIGLPNLFGGSKKELEAERKAHTETKIALSSLQSRLDEANRSLTEREASLDNVRKAFNGEGELWLKSPIAKPENYDQRMRNSIPVLLFANLKGGVAKSTLAGNLSAFFGMERRDRVLAIDLDFQGSLTSMLVPASADRDHLADGAIRVIGQNFDPSSLLQVAPPIRGTRNDSRIITCGNAFSDHEAALSLKWLIGDFNDDIRYLLAALILSDVVQKNFDRVIIDAPPRMTTGFVNALCASTHLFIPTVLDQLSTDGVKTFLGEFQRLQGRLFPYLKLCGVLGTLKRTKTDNMEESESIAVAALKRTLKEKVGYDHYYWERLIMPRMEAFARAAGVRVAYPDAAVREIVERVGCEIAEKAPRKDRLKS